jgi:hypothetical protein
MILARAANSPGPEPRTRRPVMSECITSNQSFPVDELEDGVESVYIVKVTAAMSTIRISFTPPRDLDSIGSVDGVSVTPSGPDHGPDWVDFTTSDLDTTYTVVVNYSDPRERNRLDTPTKSPKFRPQTTCPTREQ